MRYRGFTILIDPNFLHKGDRGHLGCGMRAKSLTKPAMDLDDPSPLEDFKGAVRSRITAKRLRSRCRSRGSDDAAVSQASV